MTFIGVDNGVTGTIAVLNYENNEEPTLFFETPVKTMLSYTKKAKNITRVDIDALKERFSKYDPASTRVVIERPMVNPMRFEATLSAVRALEATVICLESLGFGFEFVDSKQWQKVMLPAGIKESKNLKKASMDIGLRLFPVHEKIIKKHKDADALLIAEWYRKTFA